MQKNKGRVNNATKQQLAVGLVAGLPAFPFADAPAQADAVAAQLHQ